MSAESEHLERDVARLAAERSQLFMGEGRALGASADVQHRLRAVERQLDECYTRIRQLRAVRDRARSTPRDDSPFVRSLRRERDALVERAGARRP
jgi:hypothetical protein